MSGTAESGRNEEFATLLRQLKERSGLSYGTLAKRLHLSTSTLHRYCNGTAVPHEYAPVERFARVCRAGPQELMELHRLWILADASRGRRPDRPSTPPPSPEPPRRPRTKVIAATVAAVAVLGAVMITVSPFSADDDRLTVEREAIAPGTAAAPLTVSTRPYVYDTPCSQYFLVDSAPEQVGPPANEQDAPRWAAAYGAVSSNEQRVALTVQGTGANTVVLEALHVNVVAKTTPLPWNDYAMGVGCGGGVDTKSFDIALDVGSPTVTAGNGQRDFPYKVDESDPEVFYITARTAAHDIRWYLTLTWSSGPHRGTLRIDNEGTPFRTSANTDRPGYDYPLGATDWIPRP
ncbi:helix-turn-helix domain-containing protein [Streptomyces sp. NPDC058953]|uniref:helix-turn-helix domain-containing protein n=1 Tax=unclassified Streptomyces TaxID=2593676 RepID=UPI00367BE8AC